MAEFVEETGFDWIKSDIVLSSGKKVVGRYATQRFVNDYAELKDRVNNLVRRVAEAEQKVVALQRPQAAYALSKYLKAHPDSRERDVRQKLGGTGLWLAGVHVWEDWKKEGRIVATSHGQGRPKTWRFKIAQ